MKRAAVKPLIPPRPTVQVSCVNPVQKPIKEDKIPYYGRALYDFFAETCEEISLCKGDIVDVTYRSDDWLYVNHSGQYGYVPSSYIIKQEEADSEQCTKQSVSGNTEDVKAVYINTKECQGNRRRTVETQDEKVQSVSLTPLSNQICVPIIPPRQEKSEKDTEINLPRRSERCDDEERGYVEIVQGKETLEKIAQHMKRKAANELRTSNASKGEEQIPVHQRVQNLERLDELDVRPKVFTVQQRTVYPTMQLASMADTLELSNAIGLIEICKLSGSVEYGTGIRLDGNLMLTRLKPLQELFETSATLNKKEKEQLYKRSTKIVFGQNEAVLAKACVKPAAIFTMVDEDMSIVELKGKIVRSKISLATPQSTEDDWRRAYPFVLGYNDQMNISCHFCSVETTENEDISKWLVMRTTRLSSKAFGSPVLFRKDNKLEIIAIVIGKHKRQKSQDVDQRILDDCFRCLKLSFLLKQLKLYNPSLLNSIS